MKKHYTGKADNLINPWGEKLTGFSIYKNPDSELRNKIKSFEPEKNKVKLGFPEEKIWESEWDKRI